MCQYTIVNNKFRQNMVSLSITDIGAGEHACRSFIWDKAILSSLCHALAFIFILFYVPITFYWNPRRHNVECYVFFIDYQDVDFVFHNWRLHLKTLIKCTLYWQWALSVLSNRAYFFLSLSLRGDLLETTWLSMSNKYICDYNFHYVNLCQKFYFCWHIQLIV